VKILNDIKKFNISIPNYITAQFLKDGRGEGVCYVINETINYELMRRNFRFLKPEIKEYVIEYNDIDEDIELENE